MIPILEKKSNNCKVSMTRFSRGIPLVRVHEAFAAREVGDSGTMFRKNGSTDVIIDDIY